MDLWLNLSGIKECHCYLNYSKNYKGKEFYQTHAIKAVLPLYQNQTRA
jgi:hypothetical protein